MKNKIIISLIISFMYCGSQAQPRHVSIKNIIRMVPVIPATIEETHSLFTAHTSFGEKFRDGELLNPPFYALKTLIAEILHDRIRQRMKMVDRTDYPDSVIYEDERLKLALRPLIAMRNNPSISKLSKQTKEQLVRILDMQSKFDWQNYNQMDNKIIKSWREKIAALEYIGTLDAAVDKIELQKKQFSQQRELWMVYFNKFSKAATLLQEELANFAIDESLTPVEREMVLWMVADVQARSLEALEKMVTAEMLIVTNAEVVFQDERIIAFYREK